MFSIFTILPLSLLSPPQSFHPLPQKVFLNSFPPLSQLKKYVWSTTFPFFWSTTFGFLNPSFIVGFFIIIFWSDTFYGVFIYIFAESVERNSPTSDGRNHVKSVFFLSDEGCFLGARPWNPTTVPSDGGPCRAPCSLQPARQQQPNNPGSLIMPKQLGQPECPWQWGQQKMPCHPPSQTSHLLQGHQ